MSCGCKESKCEREISLSEKRAVNSIEKAISYKDGQSETLQTLKDITNNIVSVIQNASECGQTEIECFKQEGINSVDQYNRVSTRSCNGLQVAVAGDGKIYGTFDQNESSEFFMGPSVLATGLGGISSTLLSGSLVVKNKNYLVTSGDDIAFVANKIRKNNCSSFSVVDGTEMSIKALTTGTLTLLVKSVELGDSTETFVVSGLLDNDYMLLVENIQNALENYLYKAWYDESEQVIRIIMKAGYTVGFKSSVAGVVEVSSFINDTLVATETSQIDYLYLHGHLNFYSLCDSFEVLYPDQFVGSDPSGNPTSVILTQISSTSPFYKSVLTFNLSNVWCCALKQITKICLMYGRTSRNDVVVSAFTSWSHIVKGMIKSLDFECSFYDEWRRYNVVASLESLLILHDNLALLIENEKDLLKVLKCDYLVFNEKCGCASSSRRC